MGSAYVTVRCSFALNVLYEIQVGKSQFSGTWCGSLINLFWGFLLPFFSLLAKEISLFDLPKELGCKELVSVVQCVRISGSWSEQNSRIFSTSFRFSYFKLAYLYLLALLHCHRTTTKDRVPRSIRNSQEKKKNFFRSLGIPRKWQLWVCSPISAISQENQNVRIASTAW